MHLTYASDLTMDGAPLALGDCGTAPSFTMAHGSIMTDGRCVTAGWPFFQGAAFERPDGAVAVVVVNEAGSAAQFELEVDGDLVLRSIGPHDQHVVVRRSTGAVAAAGAARTAAAAIRGGGGGSGGWGEWGGEGGGGGRRRRGAPSVRRCLCSSSRRFGRAVYHWHDRRGRGLGCFASSWAAPSRRAVRQPPALGFSMGLKTPSSVWRLTPRRRRDSSRTRLAGPRTRRGISVPALLRRRPREPGEPDL